MSKSFTFILALAAISLCHALKATPNSACASICIDNPAYSVGSSSSFNTYGTDITCSDSDFNTTAAGEKFENCMTCLQGSSAGNETVNDQGAFFYNLKATAAMCLYGFPNSPEPVSTPCSISSGCGPLQASLESGNINSSNQAQYSYCTADGGTFLRQPNLKWCISCLRSTNNQTYLANFITALQAGCQQQPSLGQVVGLDGNIFSSAVVNITEAITPQPAPTSSSATGLTTGALVGIIVGGCLLLLGLGAFIIVKVRQRRAEKARQRDMLGTKLDERYGADNISSPNMGGYADVSSQASTPRGFYVKNYPGDDRYG